MVVKTQSNGHGGTVLNVGPTNVRRYFPRTAPAIELHLDHVQIECWLKPDFWQGEPQINDPRLTAWLEAKNYHPRPGQMPVPLAMIPSGKNCFRLQATRNHVRPRAQHTQTD